MVSDGHYCKLFVFHGDQRLAVVMWGYMPVGLTGVLVLIFVLVLVSPMITENVFVIFVVDWMNVDYFRPIADVDV